MKKAVLLCLFSMFLSSDWCYADDNKKEATALEGVWIPTSAELGGKAFPEEFRKVMKLTIKGTDYKVNIGQLLDVGTIKFDSSAKPKTMDITGSEGPNKNKTYLAIYEIDGNKLKICYELSADKGRPTEFKSKADSQLFLVIYEREKK